MPGLLKRKRSESELSFSSSTTPSSPPRPAGFDFSGMMMNMDRSPSPAARAGTPSHLHSRTLKRFRDSRPSDAEVHQHTLSLLYSAQRQQQPQQPQLFSSPAQLEPSQPQPPLSAQPSLHNFWKLPGSAPAMAPAVPPSLPAQGPTSCEDCGVGLPGEEDTGMMDVDGSGPGSEGHLCGACGKAVCFSCSVSNLGEQRRCLACAGRRVWVGGIGWTVAPMAVC